MTTTYFSPFHICKSIIGSSTQETNLRSVLSTLLPENVTKSEPESEQYHKHYPVNCSAIFAGDKHAIDEADSLVHVKNQTDPVPSDKTVRQKTVCVLRVVRHGTVKSI